MIIIKFSNSIYYYNDINLESDFQPNVSIIVSARNEEKNIGSLIDSLLKQDYDSSKIEILIANDRSSDNTEKIYTNMPTSITVGRYHSWAIDLCNNDQLVSTSVDNMNIVMSFKHIIYPIVGIQYHPESILTHFGPQILKNWLRG